MADSGGDKDLIIIGIDFGTTYSGVSWAYSREPDAVKLITSWEAELSNCSDNEKAPTTLHYGSRAEEDITWGFGVPPEKEGLKWFKLLLLEDRDVSPDLMKSTQYCRARELQKGMGQGPIELISCFLRKLWAHAISTIEDELGSTLIQKCRFHVVMTYPAMWPPYAQERMRSACQLSGILADQPSGKTTLRLVTEPEAAALATLNDLSKRSTIQIGDTMVICDAGGGTVDLVSYVIDSVTPFVVKECVGGEGDLCGGVYLDEEFLSLLTRKVTKLAWENTDITERKRFMNNEWEHGAKPQFNDQQTRQWRLHLPEGCYLDSTKRTRTIELSSDDMRSVFEPVAQKVEALVRKQVEAIQARFSRSPTYVIMVGGFGRSLYLKRRLAEAVPNGTEVLQSKTSLPWTAICRGAVHQGLTSCNLSNRLSTKVETRIARASYGISYDSIFVPGVHDVRDREWCRYHQKWKARDQIHWFLKRGEDVAENRAVRHEFCRYYERDMGEVYEDLYISSAENPPLRLGDAAVQHLCKIKWNKTVKLKSLPEWTNSIGRVYRELQHDIEMNCEDGAVGFAVYFKGKRVAAKDVQVTFF